MIGDSLSDAHRELIEAMNHYQEEIKFLPEWLALEIVRVVADLNMVRALVDAKQWEVLK